MKPLLSLILLLQLVGCATTIEQKPQPISNESFLTFLKFTSSNGPSEHVYEAPVNNDWFHISNNNNIIYYINRNSLVITGDIVEFVILNDNRFFKQQVIKEFNAKEWFKERFPEFVSYHMVLDCSKPQSTLKKKQIYDIDMNIIKEDSNFIISDEPFMKFSINESICFSLGMMNK